MSSHPISRLREGSGTGGALANGLGVGGPSVVPVCWHRSIHTLLTERDREIDEPFGEFTLFDHIDRAAIV
jgi:hypothetical protein